MRLQTVCDFTPMTRAERRRAKRIHLAIEAVAKLPREERSAALEELRRRFLVKSG